MSKFIDIALNHKLIDVTPKIPVESGYVPPRTAPPPPPPPRRTKMSKLTKAPKTTPALHDTAILPHSPATAATCSHET